MKLGLLGLALLDGLFKVFSHLVLTVLISMLVLAQQIALFQQLQMILVWSSYLSILAQQQKVLSNSITVTQVMLQMLHLLRTKLDRNMLFQLEEKINVSSNGNLLQTRLLWLTLKLWLMLKVLVRKCNHLKMMAMMVWVSMNLTLKKETKEVAWICSRDRLTTAGQQDTKCLQMAPKLLTTTLL